MRGVTKAYTAIPDLAVQDEINKEHHMAGETIWVQITGPRGSFWERSNEQVNGEVFVKGGGPPVEVTFTKKVKDALSSHLTQVDAPKTDELVEDIIDRLIEIQDERKPLDIGVQHDAPNKLTKPVSPPRKRGPNKTKPPVTVGFRKDDEVI